MSTDCAGCMSENTTETACDCQREAEHGHYWCGDCGYKWTEA